VVTRQLQDRESLPVKDRHSSTVLHNHNLCYNRADTHEQRLSSIELMYGAINSITCAWDTEDICYKLDMIHHSCFKRTAASPCHQWRTDKKCSSCRKLRIWTLEICQTRAKARQTVLITSLVGLLCLRKPDHYDSYDITSPIHNMHFLFLAQRDLIQFSIQ